MNSVRNILHIWHTELMTLLHNEGVLIFGLIVPFIYPVLYAFVYTNETVREVPVAVVDECHSSESREFSRMVDATPEVEVLYYTDLAQAQELMRQEKVYAVMRIPSDFSKSLYRGTQTYIGLYSDMRSMLYYKAALLAASNVSIAMNGDIKIERYLHGTTDRQDEILRKPVTSSYVALYNPQSGMASFLIPAVLMLIIQQLLCLTIGTSLGACREQNRGIGVPIGDEHFRNPAHVVFGKTLLYFPLFLIVAVYMYSAVTTWFSLPHLGDYVTFLRFMVPYLLACIFMALTASALVKKSEDAMLIFVFMSLPLLFVSGISWPVAAEPQFWRYVSYLFPSTFGMHGYARIQAMGADIGDLSFEYYGLWIQCLVYFAASCFFYRHEIKKNAPL